jgi:hypothetical protein
MRPADGDRLLTKYGGHGPRLPGGSYGRGIYKAARQGADSWGNSGGGAANPVEALSPAADTSDVGIRWSRTVTISTNTADTDAGSANECSST